MGRWSLGGRSRRWDVGWLARPTNRAELLRAARVEYERLWVAVESVDAGRRERHGACGDWSVKDLLAHLDAWHEMTMTWDRVGSAGEIPDVPAPGYTWSQTPALNAEIHERTKHDPWDEIVVRLDDSHRRIMAIVEAAGDDLFVKGRTTWTGSTSVGSYLTSATASHYAWASKLIRKYARDRSAAA